MQSARRVSKVVKNCRDKGEETYMIAGRFVSDKELWTEPVATAVADEDQAHSH